MRKISLLLVLSILLLSGCCLTIYNADPPENYTAEDLTPTVLDEPTESTLETLPPVVELNDEEVQAMIDAVTEKYDAVGIQVAVVDNGTIVGTYGSGWATLDTDPMTPDHKMRVASLSKIIIGMAAMKMQEDGFIKIDDNIDDYWGATVQNTYYPDSPITFRTLLTHTSSLPAHAYLDGCSYETMYERFSQPYCDVQPGSMEGYSYNNYGFCVLATTLEITANKHLDQIVSEYLFQNMDIDASFCSGDIFDPSMLVTLYNEDHSIARSASYQSTIHRIEDLGSNSANYPGGLTASASDLAKIIILLVSDGKYQGQQLMSSESVTMMEDYISEPLSDSSYQALPMVYVENIYGRNGIYYHPGRAFGALNCLSYDPETGDGIVVLTSGAAMGFAQYDIYNVCDEINEYIYNMIQ